MGIKPYKRTVVAACGVAVAVAATALASPAVAGTPATAQTAGMASATATSYKVNPTTASLSIGIGFGISLAGYTNQVAQAESRAIDLGIIGGTLAGEGCDGGEPTLPADRQPQALRADSRTSPAGTQSENEKYLPAINKTVEANPSPFAEANTRTAALAAPGAPIGLSATHSRAITRMANGVREAVATVDIESVTLPGVLELAGLHWSAVYKTGGTDSTEGSFTIGSLKVLGQNLPTSDPAAAIAAANTILAPLGVVLSLPTARLAAGILFVDPLAVRVIPSAQRDQIAAGVLGAIQPVRESLVDTLLEQDCGNATYITVADIVLGSLTGAGSFSLELGGVQAKSEALKTTSFLGGLDPIANVANDTLGGFTAFDSANSAFGDLGTPPTVTQQPGGESRDRRPALVAAAKGSRGGKLALVGLLGLLFLALVAERDRYMMRRAQRLTPTEA